MGRNASKVLASCGPLLLESTEGYKEIATKKSIQEGRQESSMRIAQAMLQERESIEKIMRFTGLSKEEIQKIKL
jgi:predicted transposase/invertase (TIGR01784 family)